MKKKCEKCHKILVRKPSENGTTWKRRRFCDKRCMRLGAINSPERRKNISKSRKGKGLGNKNGVWSGNDDCPICGRSNVKLVYDHCHREGNFRGWICFACNAALGLVNDNVITLSNLIKYLNGGIQGYDGNAKDIQPDQED